MGLNESVCVSPKNIQWPVAIEVDDDRAAGITNWPKLVQTKGSFTKSFTHWLNIKVICFLYTFAYQEHLKCVWPVPTKLVSITPTGINKTRMKSVWIVESSRWPPETETKKTNWSNLAATNTIHNYSWSLSTLLFSLDIDAKCSCLSAVVRALKDFH